MDSALDAIVALSQADITVVRGLKTPTVSLKLNLEAMCLLKNIKPDRVPDPGGPSGGGQAKMVDDFWGPSKRILGDPKFVENIAAFDKDNIPAKTAKVVREKYLSHAEVNPDKAKNTVPAVDSVTRALFRWVSAIDVYEKVCISLIKFTWLGIRCVS